MPRQTCNTHRYLFSVLALLLFCDLILEELEEPAHDLGHKTELPQVGEERFLS